MKQFKHTLFVICIILGQSLNAQVILDADGPGNTYPLIRSILAPDQNPIEVPDCGHGSFGDHIDEVFDADLNTNVFRFHIHVNDDDDRCMNSDRQRNEIKTYAQSPDNLLGISGETVQYKWKFKLDAGFQSSPNFTHIHQLKAVGGTESSMPLITLTTRKGTSSNPDQLELRYAETTSQVTLSQTDLTPFKGEWVEVIETVTYGESGTYDIEIKQVSDGSTLFSYADVGIRMWKTDADFIRPKWGIYRSLINASDLRDEAVLFANFSIEELSGSHTVTWEGSAGTHDWGDAMNWDLNRVPSLRDTVEISGSNALVSFTGTSTVARVYVHSNGQLQVENNAVLRIEDAGTDDALETSPSGTIINDGTINITNAVGQDGIYNKGLFTNNGSVSIDGTGQHGLYMSGGTFSNATGSTLSITNVGQTAADKEHLYVDDSGGDGAIFINNGLVDIVMVSGDEGIYINDGSTFNNASMVNISTGVGASSHIGLYIVDANSAFTNMVGGNLNISDATNVSIHIDNNSQTPAAMLDNAGTITITNGSNDGVRLQEGAVLMNSGTMIISNPSEQGMDIRADAIFTNDGTINIAGTTKEGIEILADAILNNNGTIDISDTTTEGMDMVGGIFNNNTGAVYRAANCMDDGLEVNTAIVNNDGAIKIYGSGSDDIETSDGFTFNNTENATFAPGSSPGEFELKGDLDLGSSTTTFEIGGTTHTSEFDRIENFSGSTLTISNAKMHLDWGAYIPNVGDRFRVIDGGGDVSGQFATVTSSNENITYTINYSNTTKVEIEVTELALALELVHFTGEEKTQGLELHWATANESKHKGFEIERSNNGFDWAKIGAVNGKGDSHELMRYTYLDKTPFDGTNYYRLKQNDFNGHFDYSNTILLYFNNKKNGLTIFPNPVKDMLYIDIHQAEENLEIQVHDSNGKILRTKKGAVKQIPFGDLPAGVYTIRVMSEVQQPQTIKIIKN